MLRRVVGWIKRFFKMSEPIPTEYFERARYVRCAERQRDKIYYAYSYFVGS